MLRSHGKKKEEEERTKRVKVGPLEGKKESVKCQTTALFFLPPCFSCLNELNGKDIIKKLGFRLLDTVIYSL